MGLVGVELKSGMQILDVFKERKNFLTKLEFILTAQF